MSVVGGWSAPIQFSGTISLIDVSFKITQGIDTSSMFRYAYLGWGAYRSDTSLDYTEKGSIPATYNTTQSFGIQGDSSYISGSLTGYWSTPMTYAAFQSLYLDTGWVNEGLSTGKYRFYITFSQTSKTNNINILSATDAVTLYVEYDVYNPPYNTYQYYVHFKDGSTNIGSTSVTYRTRDGAPGVYPYTITLIDACNANKLGYVKQGYTAIGWDISSSGTTVVYGNRTGQGSNDLTLPADIIPYSAGLNLFSVWVESREMKIYIDGEWRSVRSMGIVTSIEGDTAQITPIVTGSIYNGTQWMKFFG